MSAELFIGRQEELKKFESTLETYSEKSPFIVFIYDAAQKEEDKGGIGKTWLLHQFLEMAQAEKYRNQFIVNPEIFDFHEPIYRDRLSRISRFVRFLEERIPTKAFKPFWEALREYYARGVEVERVYQVYYDCFGKLTQQIRKRIVLFFDTYEAVEKTLNYTRYPFRFIENREGNLLFVISGRNAPDLNTPLWKGREEQLVPFALQGFSDPEAAAFFKNAGHGELDLQLVAQLNQKAKGRPILLALICDYLKNILRVEDILRLNDQDFQEQLVAFIRQFKEPPIDQAIIAMAHLKHRCDRRLLQQLIGGEHDFKKIYRTLRALSFVRRLGSQREYLVLHDEMQRMVSQYVLKNPQDEKPLRQAISRAAIPFYKERLEALAKQETAAIKKKDLSGQQVLRDEKLILQAEQWYHELYANDGETLDEYIDDFYDPNFENSLLDYCFIFIDHLRDLEELLKLEAHDRNRIQMRYVRLNMQKFFFTGNDYYRTEAERAANDLLEKARQSGKALFYGAVLCDFGQLQFYLGNQIEAEKKIRASIEVFNVKPAPAAHDLPYYQGKSKNWLGYIFFQQGKFKEAIATLEEAERHLLKAESIIRADRKMTPVRKELRRRQIDDWLAQVRGNLCRVYRERGEFSKAVVNGESSLSKRRQLGNKKEIIKGLNTLGLVYERQENLQQASAYYREAEELLRIVPDPILEGRTLTNKATVLFKRDQFSNLLVRYTRKALAAAKLILATDEAAREQARALLTHVISLLFNSNSRELAIAYNNLGELDLLEDKYREAIENFANAVKVSQLGQDTYTLLNSMQRLALAAYLKNDELQFNKFAQNFLHTQKSLKNREETARYVMRFHLTLGNFHYDKLLDSKSNHVNEHFKEAFQSYTEAVALARDFAFESRKLTQEVFAERMLKLLKAKKEISPALQNQLKTLWENKNLDISELERYFTF